VEVTFDRQENFVAGHDPIPAFRGRRQFGIRNYSATRSRHAPEMSDLAVAHRFFVVITILAS